MKVICFPQKNNLYLSVDATLTQHCREIRGVREISVVLKENWLLLYKKEFYHEYPILLTNTWAKICQILNEKNSGTYSIHF